MAADEKILFLLDGMALAYRGHFALIRNPRMTSEGMNTSAVFAFANTMLSIIEKGKPRISPQSLIPLSRPYAIRCMWSTKPSARRCLRI